MPNAFHHQPLKGLYLTYQLIVTIFIRFPVWAILNAPRSMRPKKTWTWRRSIMVKLVKLFLKVGDVAGPLLPTANHLAIAPGVNMNGVWIPTCNHLITGKLKIWSNVANVVSVRLPGYWMHRKGSSAKVGARPQPGEKVIYQLHGGAYVRLSANPKDLTAAIARGYVQHIDGVQRVFSVEYRLASHKPHPIEHPFPSQLIDALAGYNYLVNVIGFAPQDIIVSGDSAGANLAHALVRYLTDYKGTTEVSLPGPPSALILLSPWADMGSTTGTMKADGSIKKNLKTDYIKVDEGASYAKVAFLGPHGLGASDTNEYISPASLHPSLVVDFKKFPRTFIVNGGAEILYDSILTLSERMIKDLGEGNGVRPDDGKVRYHEVPDGIHDYLVFEWHEPERTDTYKAINEWLHSS